MNSLSRIKPCQQSLSILKVFKNVLKRKLERTGISHRKDGVGANYTLTSPAGQLPLANAFWSVTMYDGKTPLLIDNPINRYLVNELTLPDLKKNADGSFTIYMQKDSPGAVKESNRLPAPDGPIYVVMRIYWPKETALNGSWKPPAVQLTK